MRPLNIVVSAFINGAVTPSVIAGERRQHVVHQQGGG